MLGVVALFAFAASASGGQIKGVVVDESGGPILAFVRVIETSSGAVLARMRASETGTFQTDILGAGSYTVTVGLNGFRRRDITKIAVGNGETTDVGSIKLAFAGCDAPGVMCDEVFSSDLERERAEARVTRGELRLKLGQGADTAESGDLQFTKDGAHVYLVPANGAAVSIPNSSTTDYSDAKYSKARIRVDGLGPGVDLCVRRKDGVVSHVFFIDDVERDSPEIHLWYVTHR